MSTRRSAAAPAAVVSDAWYPLPETYWVSPHEDQQRPLRYGDLFHAPTHGGAGQQLTRKDGQPWHAVMVLSPSCELIAKAKDDAAVEVARVLPLSAQDSSAAAAIVAGWQRDRPGFPNYAAGTWGPAAADELLARDNRAWRRL